MVEAWGVRGWSLKVREEPLSTGSSRNESCYLILLSTLLRFIRQLLDALQYAANRARIVCRRRSPSLPVCPSLPPGSVPFIARCTQIRAPFPRVTLSNTWPLSELLARKSTNVFFSFFFFFYRSSISELLSCGLLCK